MNALHDELAEFSHAIIKGVPSSLGFVASPHYSADIGLEVYSNNYRGNLQDALAGAYPVIEQLVGADFFRQLARGFISLHGSCSASLFDYGAELGDFLEHDEPARALPYLPDVAKLEWACHRAYFATDVEPLNLARLSQVSADEYANIFLKVHPACYIVRSPFPIVALWQAHQPQGSFEINLASGGEIALISRQRDVVNVREITPDEAYWLRAVIHGKNLGMATVSTLETFPTFDLQNTLLLFASLGIWTDFTLGETS
ncbi:MAG: DNA-binding domain-containing protein [Sideroxydans sp.]|nr:DNA-binding domain-containing protein [Sideroxydans sp.]